MQREHLFSMSVFCFISALCVLHPPASPEASASPSAPSAPPPTANVANCCPLLPQIITPQHQVQKKHVLLKPGVILFPAQTITCSCLHTNMTALIACIVMHQEGL